MKPFSSLRIQLYAWLSSQIFIDSSRWKVPRACQELVSTVLLFSRWMSVLRLFLILCTF